MTACIVSLCLSQVQVLSDLADLQTQIIAGLLHYSGGPSNALLQVQVTDRDSDRVSLSQWF